MQAHGIGRFVPAAGLAAFVAFGLSVCWTESSANPPGIPSDLKLEYKFNLIGYPEGQLYEGGCGNGHRIFVNRNTNHAHILVTQGASWDIVDCDATGDKWAELTTYDPARYYIFVRMLGKPGGHLRICADTYEDHESGDHLCLLGTIDLTRGSGQSKFSVAPNSMFDLENEGVVWSTETNSDFRIAEFRVYRER